MLSQQEEITLEKATEIFNRELKTRLDIYQRLTSQKLQEILLEVTEDCKKKNLSD